MHVGSVVSLLVTCTVPSLASGCWASAVLFIPSTQETDYRVACTLVVTLFYTEMGSLASKLRSLFTNGRVWDAGVYPCGYTEMCCTMYTGIEWTGG